MMERAYAHSGSSFIEVYQNCLIFNDGAFESYTGAHKFENVIELKHGEPMIFGKNSKGIKLDGFTPIVVSMDEYSADDLLIHDETNLDLANIISNWTSNPVLPEPIGVIYAVDKPTYNEKVDEQIDLTIQNLGRGKLETLLNSGDTWVVE
jgi:2-oxoglutarate ferredoxin oxidoreductase subunit beta